MFEFPKHNLIFMCSRIFEEFKVRLIIFINQINQRKEITLKKEKEIPFHRMVGCLVLAVRVWTMEAGQRLG